MKIFVVTHGTNGDVLPMVRLAGGLAERGHRVTVLTHAVYAETARAAGVAFVPIDTPDEYAHYIADARRILLERVGSPSPPDLLAHYERTNLFGQLRLEVSTILERAADGDTVVVGRHTSGLSALIAAEALGAPSVWVAMTPAQHLLLPVTEYLHRTALREPLDGIRAGYGLPPVADWHAFLDGATVHIGLWPNWFDAAGPRTPERVARVGFLLNDAAESGPVPPDAADLAAGDPRPVLIACSSGQMLLDEFYAAAVHACRRAGREAILVCRYRDLLPERLPDGLHWFDRLPYRGLMPRVAAVIHHGGIGTIGRALASGVPQLVLAHSFDQPDTGARLRRCGLGEWLPSTRWEPDAAADLLAQLLDDPAYRARAARIRSTVDSEAALTAACRRIEELVTEPARPRR
jgi:UDP:flavonoid glycosyltransferase YjiC (YdhE family)